MTGINNHWHAVTDFNDQAANTSTVTMTADLTALIKPDKGIKFKLSGSYYHAVCSAITSSLLTIAGAPLTTGDGDLQELYYTDTPCIVESISLKDFYFAKKSDDSLIKTALQYFTDTSDTSLIKELVWHNCPAYLVKYSQVTRNDDSSATTQPTLMPTVGGSDVLTAALTIPDGAKNETVVEINTVNYRIEAGDVLELSVTAASGTPANDAYNLFARFIFVPE